MAGDLYKWLQRIKDVEREYTAVRLAIDRLREEVHRDSAIARGDLALRDVRRASERLEGTYTVRLFAAFEAGLRLYWATARDTDPSTYDLLNGLAATRRIPHDRLAGAHAVREFRNDLVHEQDKVVESIPLSQVRSQLCRYFAFLPPEW